ncbi:endo-1,4-beta-xylanase [Massilia sp. IC2-476]|uniref:endo-1,4-beta-xylanase n=1 Tax=Massilia sp. IC2-476 TaxID=2887199 RepID=UPI001D0FDDB7|nr:endo-1,4-beta-xylanase [Massilia sp. IC2-476]MCC2973916.1 endo-1,4-beta-xylanase [Massilia sp. IC2-476]
MTTRRTMLQALAGAALLPSSLPVLAAAAAPEGEALKDIARRKGLRFGTAVGGGRNQFGDPAYRALVERECSIIVAENEMKWQALEPARDAYRFEPADAMLAWAERSKMTMRGHNLFWQAEKWLPAWLAKEDFGADRTRAERLMRKHVQTVCQHYGTRIASWDVVNEAIDPADGKLRQNALTRAFARGAGAIDQIDLAFRLAHEYAPHAQLVYNDYMRGDTGSTKHRAGVLAMLAELKKRGTPIHALGLQAHIGSWDESPERGREDMLQWRRFLDEATAMGYDLLITEFDVNDRRLPADIAQRDAGVAAAARDFLDVTLSYPRLSDFLLWGMADHISWLQTWDEAPRADKLPMRPCPYDAQLRPKPLRQAIADAMRAMPARRA